MGNVLQMPNTTEFSMGGLTLQLRLDGRALLKIEQRLDEGVQGLFIKKQGEFKIPPINSMLIVLQGANKTSGVTEQKVAEAFLDYFDNGEGTTMDIFTVITELAEDAGLFGSKKDKEIDGESEEDVIDLTPTKAEEPVL